MQINKQTNSGSDEDLGGQRPQDRSDICEITSARCDYDKEDAGPGDYVVEDWRYETITVLDGGDSLGNDVPWVRSLGGFSHSAHMVD